MFDDCMIVDLRVGEALVFVRGDVGTFPPSRSELRRMFEELRDLEGLATIVREFSGERLDGWGSPRSRDELLDRAAELLADCRCDVLSHRSRDSLTGRAPHTGRSPSEDLHIPMLSDLLPRAPSLRHTWIEFEVVDHTGAPYAGLELDLVEHDATRHRIVLDDDGHFARKGLLEGGPATLELPPWFELTPPQRARAPIEGLRREPTDLPIAREGAEPIRLSLARRHRLVVQPSSFVVFVVVDQRGVPVDGRWDCKARSTTHASTFDGSVVRIDPVAATAEVMLELEAIALRGDAAHEVPA